MDRFVLDVRHSWRIILSQPAVALIIILTLALGIGANIAVFSVANALLLRPMPVPNPEQLVRFYAELSDSSFSVFSYANYLDLRDRATSFSAIAAHQNVSASVSIQGRPENLRGELVTGNYFTAFGINSSIGRTLLPSDDKMEQGPVVLISHALWQRRFSSDPGITNQKMSINGHVFSISGVMPENFFGSHSAFQSDFWAPISTYEMVRPRGLDLMLRGWGWLKATARLKPGIKLEQARAETDRLTATLRDEHPRLNRNLRFSLLPATALPEQLSAKLKKALGFLSLVAAAVLLVACANVAGILLSRFFARSQEIAVRHSLGANRGRLMAQFLTESTLYSMIGGVAGIVLAVWMGDGIRFLTPPDWPYLTSELAVDGTTLLYAAGVSLVTAILSAAVPLIRIRSLELNQVLREENFSGRRHSRFFGAFIAGQIAVCTLLLVVAGLLLRTMEKSLSFDPGFNHRNLVVGTIDLNRQGFNEHQGREFFRLASERLGALPGVSSVSYAVVTPLGMGDEIMQYKIPGHNPPDGDFGFLIENNIVGTNYFQTMGIPIVAGRSFDAREMTRDGAPAIIINHTMATMFWGKESPIGKIIELEGTGPMQIVGVARDIKHHSLGEDPIPYVYRSFGQAYLYPVTLNVRTSIDARSLIPQVKREVEQLNPDVALYDLMTFEEVRRQQLFPVRALALLSTIFSALALVLTSVGTYGVVSYAVRRRTREIGVRMALGARRLDILNMILRSSLLLAMIGLIAGVAGAAGLTRFLTSLLFGVSALDATTFLAVSIGLLAVTLTASLLPARRASRIDPAVSLRYE